MSQSKKNKTIKIAPGKNPATATIWYDEKIHYLVLITGAFLVYGWTIKFGYNLDDDYILYQLSAIDKNISGITEIFRQWYASADYRPVTMLSFWIERMIFGEVTTANAHFLNVFIFGLLLTQIYRFVRVGQFNTDENLLKILALLTGLFFLTHPNHVSVVANIKSRDNLLSMLFGMMCAIQFILLYDRKQYWRVSLYFLFGLLAMLSKQDAYSLIFSPLLVLLFFRNINLKKIFWIAAAVLILALLIGAVKDQLFAQLNQDLRDFNPSTTENPLFGDPSSDGRLSLSITTLLYYIKFLLIPTGYYFYYGYNQIPIEPLFHLQNILCILIVLLSAAASFYFYRYKKDKLYAFCFFFFGMSIFYALNYYIPVAGILMDRYNFIPSLAFCLALSGLLIRFFPLKTIFFLRIPAISLLLLIYTGFTIYRATAWINSFTLFDRDLPHLQQSLHANRIAAGTYIHLALEEELKPNYDKTLTDSFINKGERYALQALQVSDKNAKVWEHLGLVALYRKNYNKSLDAFKKGYEADSTYLSNINYLGAAYWKINELDSAAHYFNFVAQREKYFSYSANNLINLLLENGRRNEADSILHILSARFPQDQRLLNKISEVDQR